MFGFSSPVWNQARVIWSRNRKGKVKMFKQVKIPAEKASERPKGDTAFILLLRSTYSPPLHPRQNQSLLVFRGTPIVDSHRKFQKNSPSKDLLCHPPPLWCSVDFIWKSLISLFLLWINWNYNSSQELNLWFLFFLAPQYLQMYINSNWYFFGAPWRDYYLISHHPVLLEQYTV